MSECEVEVKSTECGRLHDRGRWYDDDPGVSWREYQMARDYEKELAAKDHALNLSDAERISDKHDIELYRQIRSEIKAVEDKLECEVRRLDAMNAAQSAYNATNSAMLANLQRQVDDLAHITRRVVPNFNVEPGWGPVTVAPAAAATTI